MATPFLIINALQVWKMNQHASLPAITVSRKHLWLILLWLILSGSSTFYRFIVSGKDVPGIVRYEQTSDWRITTINQISRDLDTIALRGEQVLALWPGYLFSTEALPFPSLENHFALGDWNKLSQGDLKLFHLTTVDEIWKIISSGSARIVVVGNWTTLTSELKSAIKNSSYRPYRQRNNTILFIKS